MRERERERERERGREKRKRLRVSKCTCIRARERQRERERGTGVMVVGQHGFIGGDRGGGESGLVVIGSHVRIELPVEIWERENNRIR